MNQVVLNILSFWSKTFFKKITQLTFYTNVENRFWKKLSITNGVEQLLMRCEFYSWREINDDGWIRYSLTVGENWVENFQFTKVLKNEVVKSLSFLFMTIIFIDYWNYRTKLKQIQRKVEVPLFFEFEKLSKIMSNI